MTNVLSEINREFRLVISEAFPGLEVPNGTVQSSAKFGDYKCTAPMLIAQVKLQHYTVSTSMILR